MWCRTQGRLCIWARTAFLYPNDTGEAIFDLPAAQAQNRPASMAAK